MSEYKFDYRLLQLPHDFDIKANMDIIYKDTISAQIPCLYGLIDIIRANIVPLINHITMNNKVYFREYVKGKLL